MAAKLEGKRIAFLVAQEGVEEVELTRPREAVEQAGAETFLVAPDAGEIQAFNHLDKSSRYPVDRTLDEASVEDFDGLVLPGGVANPDELRVDPRAVGFVADFAAAGKPIGVICHGPWTLVEADVVRGRRITSWPSLQTDIRNAGGEWVDEEVVVDNGLVSSRKPDDLPAFCAKLVEEFAEGVARLLGEAGSGSLSLASRAPIAAAVDASQRHTEIQPKERNMQFETLTDVYKEQIEDLYSAENQLVDALPGVARAAHDAKLREAIETHLEETRGHVERLRTILGDLGISSPSEVCEGMKGLLAEGEEIANTPGSGPAKDAALIAAAQRVEHYEIAAYGTARALAGELGLDDAARLLGETLEEESHANELLSKIATGGVLRSGVNAESGR